MGTGRKKMGGYGREAKEGVPAAGILSVVGTPIGNLSDMSPRAIRTLAEADVVLCEDTRVTARLLAAFDLHVPLVRCDENVMASRIGPTLGRIAAGERVAFVSDAGMPAVSDPGQRLVDAALDAGLRVEVIPGPSAVTCALVVSGLASDHFFFEGFLPRRASHQRVRLAELARIPATLVVYESPHRVVDTLANMAELLPSRRVALVRELTKLHEEVLRGSAAELLGMLRERGALRGECAIVLSAPDSSEQTLAKDDEQDRPDAKELALEGLRASMPKSAVAKELVRRLGMTRSDAYGLVLSLERDSQRD